MSLLRQLPRVSRSLARSYATVAETSGVKVAGFENGAPAGTMNLTVVVKAGSRYETQPGLAHVLKSFAFKSTSSGSALKVARETELYGGVLSAALSREHLFLTAEFLRGDEAHFLSLLASVLSTTHYYPHEYSELVLPTIESEALAAAATPSILALDTAHSLAFRRGLGNSLFASPTSPVSAADVKAFAQKAFAKSNVAVIGGGLSTEQLSKAVSSAFGSGTSSAGGLSTGSSKYFGGESRIALDSHANEFARPTMVIAFGQASAASADLQVLPHLLGGPSSVKWCAGTSPLSLAAEKVPGSTITPVVLPYSDASLFAVVIEAPTSEGVASLAKEVASVVKGVGSGIKGEDVKKAAAQAKMAEAAKFETSQGLMATVASGLFSGKIPAADSAFGALDGVSASSIGKAAGTLFKAKPTVVAVGDLAVLPYADELGL